MLLFCPAGLQSGGLTVLSSLYIICKSDLNSYFKSFMCHITDHAIRANLFAKATRATLNGFRRFRSISQEPK
ncbi:hypothetical protein VCRA2119O147_130042 [Vibrio crassostreae]|uniref:Uncharacterized protein n=1 Tax=Vibrio crassostreae TaxID=246167 RepID=A0ABM9QU82_9VIBR|nr:hypothetical protein VCRA2119O147_130042 [Vibrio crassostreae]CDT34216.1 hypothetical protein VCR4J5_200225 [Vibrio crassostreae]